MKVYVPALTKLSQCKIFRSCSGTDWKWSFFVLRMVETDSNAESVNIYFACIIVPKLKQYKICFDIAKLEFTLESTLRVLKISSLRCIVKCMDNEPFTLKKPWHNDYKGVMEEKDVKLEVCWLVYYVGEEHTLSRLTSPCMSWRCLRCEVHFLLLRSVP